MEIHDACLKLSKVVLGKISRVVYKLLYSIMFIYFGAMSIRMLRLTASLPRFGCIPLLLKSRTDGGGLNLDLPGDPTSPTPTRPHYARSRGGPRRRHIVNCKTIGTWPGGSFSSHNLAQPNLFEMSLHARPLRKRPRVSLACTNCRKRKSRVRIDCSRSVFERSWLTKDSETQCDGNRPDCSPCQELHVQCVYESLSAGDQQV